MVLSTGVALILPIVAVLFVLAGYFVVVKKCKGNREYAAGLFIGLFPIGIAGVYLLLCAVYGGYRHVGIESWTGYSILFATFLFCMLASFSGQLLWFVRHILTKKERKISGYKVPILLIFQWFVWAYFYYIFY